MVWSLSNSAITSVNPTAVTAIRNGLPRALRTPALKDAVPELGPELDDLISRLADLKKVVEKNLAHPDFMGSYSIKDVLTPMVPDLTYDGLAVADGMTASVKLARLMEKLEELA